MNVYIIAYIYLFVRIIPQHLAGELVGVFDGCVALKIIFVKDHSVVEELFYFFKGFLLYHWGCYESCVNRKHNGKVVEERHFQTRGNYTWADF